jgi:3-hydroxymyristoyl/3-hydroxydecanoyl-(acyl carrier protein) dehydratase
MIQPEKVFAGILQNRIGDHTALWRVPADLPYFNGHFPDNPIFPAIGITDASLTLLQLALGQSDLTLKSVPAAKFLSPITPGTEVRLEWMPNGEKEWQVDWKDAASARLLATVRLYI